MNDERPINWDAVTVRKAHYSRKPWRLYDADGNEMWGHVKGHGYDVAMGFDRKRDAVAYLNERKAARS